jgi:hypothetical protein
MAYTLCTQTSETPNEKSTEPVLVGMKLSITPYTLTIVIVRMAASLDFGPCQAHNITVSGIGISVVWRCGRRVSTVLTDLP